MPPKKAVRYEISKALQEFLAASGLRWKESKTSYIFTCPRCQKEEKLWMFKDTGTFICWHCAEIEGFKGRPEFALSDLTGVPVAKIRLTLYGDVLPPAELFFDFELVDWYSDDELHDEVPDQSKLQHLLWPPDALPIDHLLARRGREYLQGRGISAELATAYDIRYSGPDTRVLFPVQYRGRLFGWQGRLIGQNEFVDPDTGVKSSIPKVMTTPGLKKDQTVMFADRLERADQVIICEGPVDAIKCHFCTPQLGVSAGNIATMGKLVSFAQINLIKYSGAKRVYLALDPDADTETERLIKEFHGFLDVYTMEVPRPHKDFGEMDVAEVVEVYRNARPANLNHARVYLNPDCILFRRHR